MKHDYWRALETGERDAALAVVRAALDAGTPPTDVLRVICGAQERVGELWAAGSWSVAQEHRATAISEDAVAVLGSGLTAAPPRGHAVVACADGEWHALPARVLAEVLRLDGWRCTFLGASVPADQLSSLVDEAGPDVVAVSCSLSSSLPRLRGVIESVRGSGTPVLVGGRGTGPDGRWGLRLGANGWAPDATSAAEVLAAPAWPRYVDPAPPLPTRDDADRLLDQVDVLAASAMNRLTERFPPMASYSPKQLRSTHEDLRHIVRFLAAAVLVDDVELFHEFLGWLGDLLVARGVPLRALALGLDCLEVPGDRAAAMLVEGRARLPLPS